MTVGREASIEDLLRRHLQRRDGQLARGDAVRAIDRFAIRATVQRSNLRERSFTGTAEVDGEQVREQRPVEKIDRPDPRADIAAARAAAPTDAYWELALLNPARDQPPWEEE